MTDPRCRGTHVTGLRVLPCCSRKEIMKITTLRRLAAAAIAPTLAVGTVVAAPSAQAAPNSYAYSAARWLADQLTDGVVHNAQWDFDDYGLTLDVALALEALATRPGTTATILDAFAQDPTRYTQYEDSKYAGATGKLAVTVQLAGRDATAFGGHNLIAEAEQRVVTTGASAGRAKDLGDDYSNTITQAWVVRALSTADSDLADDTVGYLLKQQCDDGSFRTDMKDEACATGAGTIDATALALQALDEAQDAGEPGLQDDIDEGVDWLLDQQRPDGSFLNDGAANTNSTGLAAATLKTLGEPGAAGSAASWIVSRQVTDAVGEDTLLANELGAIAFDDAALAAGKTAGITVDSRDQWIRATAQAAVGVDAQLAATKLTVSAPTGFVSGGKRIAVTVKGLAAGEKVTVTIPGARVTGTAGDAGSATVQVPTPTSTGKRTIAVTGARASRSGAGTVQVLGAKKLPVSVRSASVKKGKGQRVTVSGLAAAEPVTIRYRGKDVKKGKASSKGTFSHTFTVGSSAGKKTIKVTGAFSNRTGSRTFKVTR
ncbi:hypothetical protein GEV29_05355 [Aeromicrobium sp. SMF47]|nr:hypothetical protein [Aeromicrobium yanjiei]